MIVFKFTLYSFLLIILTLRISSLTFKCVQPNDKPPCYFIFDKCDYWFSAFVRLIFGEKDGLTYMTEIDKGKQNIKKYEKCKKNLFLTATRKDSRGVSIYKKVVDNFYYITKRSVQFPTYFELRIPQSMRPERTCELMYKRSLKWLKRSNKKHGGGNFVEIYDKK